MKQAHAIIVLAVEPGKQVATPLCNLLICTMIGFLLRKTFYDLWDNLIKIVALNLGFILCTTIPVFLPMLTSRLFETNFLDLIAAAFGILICTVYLAAASYSIRTISDYSTFDFADLIAGLKKAWPAGIVMGFFVFFLFFLVTIVFPFYLIIEPPLAGLAFSAIIFWVTVYIILSFQY